MTPTSPNKRFPISHSYTNNNCAAEPIYAKSANKPLSPKIFLAEIQSRSEEMVKLAKEIDNLKTQLEQNPIAVNNEEVSKLRSEIYNKIEAARFKLTRITEEHEALKAIHMKSRGEQKLS